MPTGELVEEARRGGRGIPAFNAITLEHAEGIAAGAERANLPAIIQVSQNAIAYHGGDPGPILKVCAAVAESSTAALSLHADHIDSTDLLHALGGLPISSVMYDGSALPYEHNIAATAAARRWAGVNGWWLESELGEVGGKGAHVSGARTAPDEANDFVVRTGIDALAVAVGSSHAMLEQTAVLNNALITALAAAVSVPLVLHGSTGVPRDALREAVRAGMTKINIGTALNIAFTSALRGAFDSDAPVDPRKYLAPARDAAASVVADYLTLLA